MKPFFFDLFFLTDILLSDTTTDSIKIVDFGQSRILTPPDGDDLLEEEVSTVRGAGIIRAPEVNQNFGKGYLKQKGAGLWGA